MSMNKPLNYLPYAVISCFLDTVL